MATFDLNTFLTMTGGGAGPVQALGTAYGMPTCMLNLTDAALNLLPSPILNQIRGAASAGSNRADDVLKAAFRKLRWLTGIIEIDTEDGIFRFISDTSKNGIDSDEGGILNTIGGFVGAVGAAAGFAGRLYTNYQNISAQINSLTDCVKGYLDYLKYTGGNAANQRQQLANMDPSAFDAYVDAQFGAEKNGIETALDFKNKADSLVNGINGVLLARASNPRLEPEFTYDYADILSGTNLKIQSTEEAKSKEIFRLDFGPPKSTNGRFLLSVDGLYFDSQTSGIVPALLDIRDKAKKLIAGDRWKFEHSPNIGGKGKGVGTKDLNLYVNTILDPNIIDDSKYLKTYYDSDIFLNDLIGQKNKRIFDLSSQISELESGSASEAIIANYRQVLLSDNAKFIEKINKRKKQIELAIKMPYIYGKTTSYKPGEVPINDFSYLEGINFLMDIQKQKALLLRQDDVSGVILPINSVFVTKKTSGNNVSLDHLLIAEDGVGSIISDSSSVSSISGVNLSITETIVTDGLFALYNFLQTNVKQPSSTDFNLYNGIEGKNENNALLVADRPQYVYFKGLAVPYLLGVTRQDSTNPVNVSAPGSYVKLPESKDFNDFLYNKAGATFETWVHVPHINDYQLGYIDNGASSLYRLILANENTGLTENVSAQSNILNLVKDSTNNSVKGLVMGFTVDRRITQDLSPINASGDNDPAQACFFIAPTQSYDNSSIGFINRSYHDTNNCDQGSSYHNMKVNIWDTINGKSFSSLVFDYHYLSVVFDTPNDQLKVYLDSVLMATSSISNVFVLRPKESINIPTFKRNNSFQYLPSTVNDDAPLSVKSGPKLGKYFTPWILGGGFTDGNKNGNFMGGSYGGIISGLRGFLGSTKFYNKPLNQSEIAQNYNSQKVFFQNVDIAISDFYTSLGSWEHVLVTPS